MKTILISALAAMTLGACASQTGLGNTVSGGAYGELSPDWEKASKAEAKAQNLIDKGEARIEKGEKKIQCGAPTATHCGLSLISPEPAPFTRPR